MTLQAEDTVFFSPETLLFMRAAVTPLRNSRWPICTNLNLVGNRTDTYSPEGLGYMHLPFSTIYHNMFSLYLNYRILCTMKCECQKSKVLFSLRTANCKKKKEFIISILLINNWISFFLFFNCGHVGVWFAAFAQRCMHSKYLPGSSELARHLEDNLSWYIWPVSTGHCI